MYLCIKDLTLLVVCKKEIEKIVVTSYFLKKAPALRNKGGKTK